MNNEEPPVGTEDSETKEGAEVDAVMTPDEPAEGESEQPAADPTEPAAGDPPGETTQSQPDRVTTTHESAVSGHRVTRRTIKRREVTENLEEDIEETITEDVPAIAYQAPVPQHPRPVG